MTIVLTQPPTTRVHRPSITLCTFDSDTWCAESPRLEMPALTATAGKSRPLPSLPAELHLDIIDIIARRVPQTPCPDESYDPADLVILCACALVCKLWLNTARIKIWAGVRLSGRKKSMAFVRLLRAYARGPGDGVPTWTIPSPGRYVAHLSIRETRGNAWDPKWLNDALPHLAAHLPRVQSLEMERVTWEYLSSRSRTACLSAFKHAKNLTLRGFAFHTTRDMYGFLGEFTELEMLTLDGVHCAKRSTPTWLFDSAGDGEGAIKPPPGKLKEVGCRDAPMEPVLEWIMAGSNYQRQVGKSGPKIESVRMGGVGVSEANIVGRFLRAVGDSLKKVHIGFKTDFMERGGEYRIVIGVGVLTDHKLRTDVLVREMELAENTNLEEFHIFGLVVPSPPLADPFEQESTPPQRALEALTLLLSQIRSRMRVLSLALYPADLRAMSAIDFEGLTKVFEKCVWSYLDEVRVVISNKGEYGLGKAVKERLRVLHERGVLKVNVGFDEREVL
ncbi:hypothetical protein J3R83DRAFT_4928 [Lanmaoa asiatica]|nr:hypothetical protein J3R83DRAFT_4928 [Lanmaoa asiatica]